VGAAAALAEMRAATLRLLVAHCTSSSSSGSGGGGGGGGGGDGGEAAAGAEVRAPSCAAMIWALVLRERERSSLAAAGGIP
jgi:hypothetical protein